jgi:hypothetical protein
MTNQSVSSRFQLPRTNEIALLPATSKVLGLASELGTQLGKPRTTLSYLADILDASHYLVSPNLVRTMSFPQSYEVVRSY